jgi:HEAT repeat protein
MVLLDPDRDLLAERKAYNYAGRMMEQEFVAKWAPNSVDREAAMIAMISGETDSVGRTPDMKFVDILKRETSPAAIASVLQALAPQKKAGLRPYYREFLSQKDGSVRAAAIQAIAALPKSVEDLTGFRARINDREEFGVVTAALRALGRWDADGNIDVIRKAMGMDSRHEVIRLAAVNALDGASGEPALALAIHAVGQSMPRPVRRAGVDLLSRRFLDKPGATRTLVDLIKDEDPKVREATVFGLIQRKDINAVGALRALEQSASDQAIKAAAKRAADGLEGK